MQHSRLEHIDVWRFIAIGMVLISHIVAYSHPWYKEFVPGLVWRLQPTGHVGVQIFFCISGFVICRGLLREFEKTGRISQRNFFIRRAYRILPPLAVYILCIAALASVGVFSLPPSQFAAASLFLCNLRPIVTCEWVLGHTWSLAFEEQFYLIFPFLVVLFGLTRQRHRLLWILGGMVCVSVAAEVSGNAEFLAHYLRQFTYILAGCACALYWDKLEPSLNRTPPLVWLACVMLILGINLFAIPDFVKTFLISTVFPALVCVAVFGTPVRHPLTARVFSNPALAHLGRMSYGVYLWQQLATCDFGFSSPTVAIALVFATFVLAHYSYVYFEQPFMRFGAQRAAQGSVPQRAVRREPLRDPLDQDSRDIGLL